MQNLVIFWPFARVLPTFKIAIWPQIETKNPVFSGVSGLAGQKPTFFLLYYMKKKFNFIITKWGTSPWRSFYIFANLERR